jgi:hypothetical protein
MFVVRDGLFKDDLCNLIAKGTESFQWTYHHKSDLKDPGHNKFFVCRLWDPTVGENLYSMLWRLIHKDVPIVADYYCWRVIANGQVKGQDGNWHTDLGDTTVVYFPLEWAAQWGGSTYLNDGQQEIGIQYKRNRAVIFDSNMLHYGSCPDIDNVLRVSIAFNLRKNVHSLASGDEI